MMLLIERPVWVILPIDNDMVNRKTSARQQIAAAWWVLASMCMLSVIVVEDVSPTWFSVVMAAEMYMSVWR
jgi:hypothetical protein